MLITEPRMRKLPFATILFAASRAFCQSPQPEPAALRALLVEVHQLRVDLQAMTVASSRVQIALQSLQLQDAAVGRAAQRLDELRNKCAAADIAFQRISADLQTVELASPIVGPEIVPAQGQGGRRGELRRFLGTQTSAVQACKATEAEAASQLRNDQAKMTELQDRISRLDKTLEQLGTATK
jgi:hypothetical protein